MAALPPVPNVLRLQFKGTYGTTRWLNGIYLQYTGAPADEADLQFLAQSFDDDWAEHWGPLLCTGIKLTEVQLTDLHHIDGAGYAAATSKDGTGGIGTQRGSTSACVSLKQTRRFRGGHHRIYLPPPADSVFLNQHQFNSTYINDVKTRMEDFKDEIEARSAPTVTAIKWVTVSRFHGHTFDDKHNRIPTPLATPIVREVVMGICHARVDTQRRRLGKQD